MRATLHTAEKVFETTNSKAVHESARLKAATSKALKRQIGSARTSVAKESVLAGALSPQLRFLAMNRAQRAKAFLAESKAMARFYANHPEEVLPDFYDHPEHESAAR